MVCVSIVYNGADEMPEISEGKPQAVWDVEPIPLRNLSNDLSASKSYNQHKMYIRTNKCMPLLNQVANLYHSIHNWDEAQAWYSPGAKGEH